MKYGKIDGIDKPVSRIAQGLMMIGTGDKRDYTFQLLDGVFAQGINTFDSSHVYGGGACDRAFGQWVAARGVRDRVVLLEKGAHHNPDRRRVTPWDITADIYDCLARLKFDYLDLFVLHRDDPAVPVGPIVETLNEHLAAGRIRAFGGSNWTHTRIAEANAYARSHGLRPFTVSSPQFSLAEMVCEPWEGCISISGPQNEAVRQWYAANRMPLFTWSSLGRGFFSGRFDRAAMESRPPDDPDIAVKCFRCEANLKRLDRVHALAQEKGLTVPQVATAYVLNFPLDIYALIGACTPDEAAANVTALDVVLTPAELAWFDLRSESR